MKDLFKRLCLLAFLASLGFLLLRAVSSAAPAPDPDLNNDGVVNSLDVSIISSCLGKNPRTPPAVITITSPTDGAVVTASPLSVSGRVSNSTATVNVNGRSAQVSADGTFTATGIVLQGGPNTITVTATLPANKCQIADTDDDGDVDLVDLKYVSANLGKRGFPLTGPVPTPIVSTASIGVFLGPQQLSVAINTPAEGTLLQTSPVNVTGTVNDPSATVMVNGIRASVAANGAFTAANVPLTEGQNTLTATATRTFGNQATTSVTVAMDTTAPQITITTPADHSTTFESQVRVAGTMDDNQARLTLNGQAVPISNGVWEAEIPLTIGANTVVLVASDLAGNSSQKSLSIIREEPQLVSISVTPVGLRFEAAALQRSLYVEGRYSDGKTQNLTSPETGTSYQSSNPFAAKVSADGMVTSVGTGSATIVAKNGNFTASATVTVEIGVSLERLSLTPNELTFREVGATQQLSLIGTFSDSSNRDLTAAATGTVYTSSDSSTARVSADGLVTAVAPGSATLTAANGSFSATAQVKVIIATSKGFLRGEVYDDSKGLPLAGATVTLIADGGGSLATPKSATTDKQGRFVFSGLEGDALVQVQKSGFTGVERHGRIPSQTAANLLDMRLSPLDARVTNITAGAGGEARDSTGAIKLLVSPGSLDADAQFQLTSVSNQGLQERLPLGWSPIAVVDLRPAGLAFGQPALLQLPNTVGLPAGAQVTAVYYDLQDHQWVALNPAQVTENKSFLECFLARSGQIVLLVSDDAPLTPPAAEVGQALQGVVAAPLPETLESTGQVTPPSAPPGEKAKAIGTVTLKATDQLPSGTVVQAHVSEQFSLLDDSLVVPAPYIQDLLLYARPSVVEAPGIGTQFPITPSRDFALQELEMGTVRLKIATPEDSIGGTVIGTPGGTVSEPAGGALEIPAEAAGGEIIAQLSRFSTDFLALSLPEGVGVLAALQADLSGAVLSQSARLSVARPASIPEDLTVLVARVLIDAEGVPFLKIVALGQIGATRVTSQIDVSGLNLPGITEGGQYLFVTCPVPLGFVSGKVFDRNGASGRGNVFVASSTAPFADVTDAAGNYLVAGAVNQITNIAALDQSQGDLAAGNLTLSSANEAAKLDLTLHGIGPSILSTSPKAGDVNVPLSAPILVQFSEALNPASITATTVFLDATGASHQIRWNLSPDHSGLTIVPTAGLGSKTLYTLLLTQGLTDAAGNPLTASASISFTTVDTSKPAPLPAGQITARLPDEDGLVMIFGTQGTAEPGTGVTATNTRTQETFTLTSETDGSFRIRLAAVIGDQISLTFRNATGQNVTLAINQFEDPDGSTALGTRGGTVSGPGGRIGRIIERALTTPGIFKIFNLADTSVLPTLPSPYSFVDAFELTAQGAEFNQLRSLTLQEGQNRFDPQIASVPPFTAAGSLIVPSNFIVNGNLNFSATAEDSCGNKNTANGATLVVASSPNTALLETSAAARFPTVIVSVPTQALPNQQVDAYALAPAARMDFEIPAPAGITPETPLFLARLTTLNGEKRLSLVDQLQVVESSGSRLLKTLGRELPGTTTSGQYVVIASSVPLAKVGGKAGGSATTVSITGTPFIFETTGPNEGFSLPVPAGGAFQLSFIDPLTGTAIGATSGTAPVSGSADIGDPLGRTVAELTVSAQPDSKSVADIKGTLVFTFSEPLDTRTVNSGTVIVTDAAGNRVYGSFTFSEDGTRVTFTPQRRWKYSTTYRYGVTTGVLALSGAKLARTFSGGFATFAPRLLASIAADKGRDVAAEGNLAILGGDKGLTVLDVSQAESPVKLNQVLTEGGTSGVFLMDDPAVGGVVGLAATGDATTSGQLRIFDLSVPETPKAIGSTQLSIAPGQSPPTNIPNASGVPNAIAVGESAPAVVAVRGIGLETLDLASAIPEDLSEPGKALRERYPTDSLENFNHAVLLGNRILAVGTSGFKVLDAVTADVVGEVSTSGEAQGVAALSPFSMDVNGDGVIDKNSEIFILAVVANGQDGSLQFYNITNPYFGTTSPAPPILVSVVRLGAEVTGVVLDREENLAYVACGTAGVKIVDLAGPASIQPIDYNLDGIDDRILGQVKTAGSARRLALDLGRGVGFVADGAAGLSTVQLIPPRSRFVGVARDPLAAATGDENSILESREAYLTDDCLKVSLNSVVPPQSPLFLTVEEIPETGELPVLYFQGGGKSAPLAGGLSTTSVWLDKSKASNGSRVVLRVQDQTGAIMDTLELRLVKPDLTPSTLASLFVAPRAVTIPVDQPTAQISVGAVSTLGKTYNVTSSSSGTGYTMENPVVASIGTEGLVTGLAGGNTAATASNGSKTARVPITVAIPPAITAIDAPTPYVTLTDPGATKQLSILGLLSNGGTQNVTLSPGTQFSSSDQAVVSIDSSGNLIANSEGTAEITITNGDYTTSVQVAVELRIPPTVTGIELTPFTKPVTTDSAEALAKATIQGSGSLEGIQVVFSTSNGVPGAMGVTDYSGIAMAEISGFTNAGNRTVTATVLDPASGSALSDSKPLTVESGSGDNEPNNDFTNASRLGVKRLVQASVGDETDARDVYSVDHTTAGRLTIQVSSNTPFPFGQVTLAVHSGAGVELARSTLDGLEGELAVDVPEGRNFVTIEAGSSLSYQIKQKFKQVPVNISSISPLAGGAGTPVTITGSGFSSALDENLVFFGGVPGKVIASSSTQISVLVPAMAVNSNIYLIVRSETADGPLFDTGSEGPEPGITFTPADPSRIRFHPIINAPVNVSRILVEYDALASRSDMEDLASFHGGSIVGHAPALRLFTMDFPANITISGMENIRRKLQKQQSVKYTLPFAYGMLSSSSFQIDSDLNANNYNQYDKIRLSEAVELVRSNSLFQSARNFKAVRVAVIDNGFQPKADYEFDIPDHKIMEVFSYKYISAENQYDFQRTYNYIDFSPIYNQQNKPNISRGHATSVVSIISALNNSRDMNGVLSGFWGPGEDPLFNIWLNDMSTMKSIDKYVSADVVVSALNSIYLNKKYRNINFDVINMSFVFNFYRDFTIVAGDIPITDNIKTSDYYKYFTLFQSLFDLLPDVLVVVAAGNGGIDVSIGVLPADMSRHENVTNVITVGASTNRDGRARFSNYGDSVQIAAPGVDVYSATGVDTYNEDNSATLPFKNDSGTSFSTPMVAGAAAILQAIRPTDKKFSPSELIDILVETGDAIGTDTIANGWSPGSMRRLNIENAVLAVLSKNLTSSVYVSDFGNVGSNYVAPAIVSLPVNPATGGTSPDNAKRFLTCPLFFALEGGEICLCADPPVALEMAPSGEYIYALVESRDIGAFKGFGSGILIISTETMSALKFMPLSGAEFSLIGMNNTKPLSVSLTKNNIMAISPDGRLLYISKGDGIIIVNTIDPKVVKQWTDLPSVYGEAKTGTPAPQQLATRLQSITEALHNTGVSTSDSPVMVINGLAMSSDGKVLYASLTGGIGSTLPNQILAINVDLYSDADLSQYLVPEGLMQMSDTTFNGYQDLPKDITVSPLSSAVDDALAGGAQQDKERIYLLHGRAAFVSSSNVWVNPQLPGSIDIPTTGGSAGSWIAAPGWTGVFDGLSTAPLHSFLATKIIGSRRVPPIIYQNESIYSRAPAAMSIRPDGKRALVAFSQTGNFGVMDRQEQTRFSEYGFELPSDDFLGFVGVTSKIEMDSNGWPINWWDLPLMYPSDVRYAQNGRFAVAVHGGTSGPTSGSDDMNNPMEQRGAISIISDDAITQSFNDLLSPVLLYPKRPIDAPMTPYFSVYPICKNYVPFVGCTEEVSTHLFGYTTPEGNYRFRNPKAVAIQPFLSFITPRFGDFISAGNKIYIRWTDPRVNGVDMFAINMDTGEPYPSIIDNSISYDERGMRQWGRRVNEIFGSSLPKGKYKVEAKVKIGTEVLSSQTIMVTIKE
jgi:hypothetical protein